MKLAAAILTAALLAGPPAALAGDDLLPNGTFDTLAGWSGYNAKLSQAPGAAIVTATAAGTISIYPSPRPVRSTAAAADYAAAATVTGAAGKTLCVQVREWASSAVGTNEACAVATGARQEIGPVSYTTKAAGHSLEAYVYEKGGAKGDVFRVDQIALTDSTAASPPPPPPPPPPPTQPAPSAGVYVSPSGSDANPGTVSAPWQTLQHALDSLSAGQTLYLRAGTYPGWVNATHSGTASAPITIASYPGEQPVITGRLKVAGSWTTVSRLHFVGRTPGNPNGVLLYVSGADHVSIVNDEFDHADMSAMYLGDVGNGSDDVTIAGNYIHDNGTHTNLDHGIYMGTGTRATIVNNVIEHNFARGIQCYPDCDNALIANNTVVGNGRAGIQVGNENVSTSDNDLIVNNVVVGNGNTGIRSYWGGTQGTNIVARDNLLWHNAGTDTAGPGISFVANVVGDPLFVGADDFHVGASSPARAAALLQYAPAENFDGVLRGALPNLGAF